MISDSYSYRVREQHCDECDSDETSVDTDHWSWDLLTPHLGHPIPGPGHSTADPYTHVTNNQQNNNIIIILLLGRVLSRSNPSQMI